MGRFGGGGMKLKTEFSEEPLRRKFIFVLLWIHYVPMITIHIVAVLLPVALIIWFR